MKAVAFGSLFQFIRNGMNIKQDKSGQGLPVTRIETISDATVDGSRVGFAGLAEADCRDWLLEPGDILFSHINSVEHIGKCAVYRGEPEKLVHGMNLLCLRSYTGKLLPEFAKYLIRGKEFRQRLANFINKAVNQASVSIGNLKTIPVTVPPLAEQRRIAEILDKADALRAKRRAALAELNTLTQSIFLDMFGDPATNPKAWPVLSLRECTALIQIGPFGSLLHQEDYIEGGIPLVNPKHIQRGAVQTDASETICARKFAELESYHLRAGDVVMGRRGEMGRCAIVNEDSGPLLCGTGSLFIRPDNVHTTSLFLLFLLSSAAVKARLEQLSLGQTLPNLNSQIVEGLKVPSPPLMPQREFAARATAIRSVVVAQNEATTELDSLFASLQHRAFRGEL